MTLTSFPRPPCSHASRQGNPNRQVGPTVPREQGEWQEGAWQGQGQVGQSEAGGPGKMASHSMLPWLGGFVRKAFCPLGPYWPLPPAMHSLVSWCWGDRPQPPPPPAVAGPCDLVKSRRGSE